MKYLIPFIALVLVLPLSATSFTVKAGGGGSFTTIQACATAMAAGDSCTVFAGTYNENVSITAGGVGSYKTVTVNGADTVTITGTVTVNSHTKVIGNCPALAGTKTSASCGFFITNPSSPTNACVNIPSGATDFYVVSNNMYACGGIREQNSLSSVPAATHGFIQGNTVSWACSTSSSPNTCGGIKIQGDYHLVENNDISHVSDGFVQFVGRHNVLRNNTMHDTLDTECGSNSSNCHIDFMETEPNVVGGNVGSQFNLFEGNTEVNNIGSNGHGYLTQGDVCSGQCNNAIIRFHTGAHVGGGGLLDDAGGFYNVKTYNNTWADFPSAGFSSGGVSVHWKSNSFGGSALNSIWYFPGSSSNFNPLGCEDTSCSPFNHGHNLAYCAGGCTTLRGYVYGQGAWLDDTGNLYSDPLFTSYSSSGIGNLSLQAGSPAKGTGTFLTTANGAGSSSTALIVADSGYFQDGSGIPGVQADWIRIGASTTVQIASIVDSTHITLASPVSWSSGNPIYLYKDSSGTTQLNAANPDMGAFQTGGGTTFALNISKAGLGTGTVTTADGFINCGATCSHTYNSGDSLVLTGTPTGGGTFSGWSVDCSGTGTCSLTMNATHAATATFAPPIALTLAPPSLSFGNQTVSTTSAGQTVNITNNSGSTITLFSENLQTGTQFAKSANTCGASLTNGSSCAVTVTFTPTSTGAQSDNLVITSSAGASPQTVPLSGTGQAAATVATPTFSPVAGTYSGTQSVTISTGTSGATLCYTTNGTTPTANGAGTCTNGTTYSTPVSIAVTTTLKAIGSKSGSNDSSVASALYTITAPGAPTNLTGTISFLGTSSIQ